MKKKVLALVCAAVMVMGMSVTVFAAPSTTSGSVASSPTITLSNSAGQVIDAQKVSTYFVASTSAEGGCTVSATSMENAEEAIEEAIALYGNSAFIATVVDITPPAGVTYPYALTINCDNVWAGQTVTILHKVNGEWERLRPSSVADNKVTVTVNSFSPFAIVINTGSSPQTSDMALMVSGLAGLFATGTVFTRKRR